MSHEALGPSVSFHWLCHVCWVHLMEMTDIFKRALVFTKMTFKRKWNGKEERNLLIQVWVFATKVSPGRYFLLMQVLISKLWFRIVLSYNEHFDKFAPGKAVLVHFGRVEKLTSITLNNKKPDVMIERAPWIFRGVLFNKLLNWFNPDHCEFKLLCK